MKKPQMHMVFCLAGLTSFFACELVTASRTNSEKTSSSLPRTPIEKIHLIRDNFDQKELSPFFDCYENFTERLAAVELMPESRARLVNGFADELEIQIKANNQENGWSNLRKEFQEREYCSVFWTAFGGVVAHIGYDLVFSLVRNFPTSTELEKAAFDYFRIGDELQAAVPEIQNLLATKYDAGISKLSSFTPFDFDASVSAAIVSSIRRTSFEIALRYRKGELSETELQTQAYNNYLNGLRAIDGLEALIRPSRLLENYCKEE